MSTVKNVLVLQSGGCTAVMNRSLVGVVQEIFRSPGQDFGEVYGAVHGLFGVLGENFLNLRRRRGKRFWASIANSPGAALGSGRRSLRPEEIAQVLKTLRKHNIGYLFTIGGNDTAETAHQIASASRDKGEGIAVIHIPKTIDNDLLATDHTPGYGSAARFIALATMGAGRDAEAMGAASPVTILEVMGRDAGWLAASASLGKRDEVDAPHYICVPEVPLDEGRFLSQVESAYRRLGFAVVVTAENVAGTSGPIGGQQDPYFVDDFGHVYFEGPGRYLAQLVSRELKVRARFEKPGTIQRSLSTCVSRTDAREATLVGQAAVGYALQGHSDSMVVLLRKANARYECGTGLAPLEDIAGEVKVLPLEYFDPSLGQVTQPYLEYLEYASPLIGGPLPRFARMSGDHGQV